MQIQWHKNPLYTKIILDERDKELFKAKIMVKELQEVITEGYFTLSHHDWRNSIKKEGEPKNTLQDTIDLALKDLKLEYVFDDEPEKGISARVETMYNYYMADLDSYHVGDCTCVACSCSKCGAEEILGINTMKGIGKHSAYKINGAFGKNNEKTIEEALESLRDYKVTPPTSEEDIARWEKTGGFDKHVPRWQAEAASAYNWLLNYAKEHQNDFQ